MIDSAYYRDLVRPLVQGRKIVLAVGVLTGSNGRLKTLRDLGAQQPPFLLAETMGTGAIPSKEEALWGVVGRPASSIMDGIRSYEAGLLNPPAEVLEALDQFDPRREALVLAGNTVEADVIAGRRRYGPPERAWRALEDKMVVDLLWDVAEVPRAPSRILWVRHSAVSPETVRQLDLACQELDWGSGTAWVGDNREGWHGGAEYFRRVQTPESFAEALEFFREHCDRVRVMPFLEGVACSIHGMVFPETVIALRPMEMIVLRRPGQARLQYAGMASFWDPAPEDREEMRSIARRVGLTLRRQVGYRGAFTIDGVMTADGFRPTELNARTGAGLGLLARSLPDLPLDLIEMAVRAGEPLDFRPADLERIIIESADARRGGGVWSILRRPIQDSAQHFLVEENGAYRFAREGEIPDASVSLGPSVAGGFVSFLLNPDRTRPGPSAAPRVASAYRFFNEVFDADFGPLEAPRDVRRERLASRSGKD
jgi:hypothetical protein